MMMLDAMAAPEALAFLLVFSGPVVLMIIVISIFAIAYFAYKAADKDEKRKDDKNDDA
ncbi:MAG: hypothetical protein IJ062_11920 [Firmicutes bacterium]|nr:hypothetical protein [Bacillota bacterium]